VKRCNGEEERRRLELGVSARDSGKELRNKGKRCGVVGGGVCPFIGVGSIEEAFIKGITTVVNGLLMARED
jgi:hypothetical protein